MSRLTQQLSTISKSLIRISEKLTELALQLDNGGPSATTANNPQKTAEMKK